MSGVSDCSGSSFSAAAFTSSGTSWKKASSMSTSPTSSCQPVAAHHSLNVSPGRGTIALTRISSSTGTRSQTSGAVNPPYDCATSTTGRRSPIASTTASAYSASPALSSSAGRSTAIALRPRRSSSATTRCQYHAAPPAPGTSTRDASMSIGRPSRGRLIGMDETRRVYSTADGDLRKTAAAKQGRLDAPSTPNDGIVRVSRETSGRRGKTVTVIRGIPSRDLAAVASDLKRRCGSGGAAKDGVVEIQGDHRPKVVARLEAQGYKVRLAGTRPGPEGLRDVRDSREARGKPRTTLLRGLPHPLCGVGLFAARLQDAASK